MVQFANGLKLVFEDNQNKDLAIKRISLQGNGFGDGGLFVFAKAIGELSRVGETLEELNLSHTNITTLKPLVEAHLLERLQRLTVSGCPLSGDEDVLPPQLSKNFPALKYLDLDEPKSADLITLTVEALCLLPSKCIMNLRGARAQVVDPTWKDAKILPTLNLNSAEGLLKLVEAENYCTGYRATLIKPAKLTNARCGSCASPRPEYACAGCKTAKYCNEQCQAKDWQRHQRACNTKSD